ncbi:plasmid mobilization relaxosome protein MobC [Flavobacterium aquariorum]|uniref:Plasmid mobilization relaxosome protein MobC n=2 Tax=Flavobacterium aquariorum TaxID=2217670 RepID=A0A2W7TRE0_9FLAO|nr:plasmid mobilization relaxosome protein MobC [Flavobacterium aquariorum]PZX92801.1 plasmid mobilization relaxosome protein MobC [Flavobacterium aquariorum]
MMKRENSNRTRIVGLRFTPEEYAQIERKFRASTCRKLSDHIRRHLFNKPIVTTYRNQSLDDFIEETITLTNELNSIGNNINQIAKKVNTLKQIPEFKEQLLRFEFEKKILFNKMDEVRNHTQKISESWLQL